MYYVFFFLPILLYFVLKDQKDKRRARHIFVLIMTFLLSICSALRHEYMGNDTINYMNDYEVVSQASLTEVINNFDTIMRSSGDDEGRDPGYPLLTKICSYLMSFRVFLFFVALIFVSAIGHFIEKYVKNLSGFILAYAFYISLYYHYLPNSAVRQTLAMGFLLWAYVLWFEKNKKLWPFLIFLAAITIHKSVLLGIVPFALSFVRSKNAINYITIIVFALFVAAGQYFSTAFSSILGSETYMQYAQSSAYSQMGRPIGFVLQMLGLYLVSLLGRPDINEQGKMDQFISICFYLGIMTAPIILVSPSQIRGNAYFAILGVVFIPNIVYYANKKIRLYIYLILLALTLGRPLLQGVVDFNFMWDTMQYMGGQ